MMITGRIQDIVRSDKEQILRNQTGNANVVCLQTEVTIAEVDMSIQVVMKLVTERR